MKNMICFALFLVCAGPTQARYIYADKDYQRVDLSYDVSYDANIVYENLEDLKNINLDFSGTAECRGFQDRPYNCTKYGQVYLIPKSATVEGELLKDKDMQNLTLAPGESKDLEFRRATWVSKKFGLRELLHPKSDTMSSYYQFEAYNHQTAKISNSSSEAIESFLFFDSRGIRFSDFKKFVLYDELAPGVLNITGVQKAEELAITQIDHISGQEKSAKMILTNTSPYLSDLTVYLYKKRGRFGIYEPVGGGMLSPSHIEFLGSKIVLNLGERFDDNFKKGDEYRFRFVTKYQYKKQRITHSQVIFFEWK